MPEQIISLRELGIVSDDQPPPPATVQCFFSTRRLAGQFVSTIVVSSLGVGLTVLFALLTPLPMSLLGCAAALAAFAIIVFLATHNDYRWIELDGNTIRAKHLYTGRTIVRSVEEIESLAAMVNVVKGF